MQALNRTARNATLLLGLLVIFFLTLSLQVNRGQTLAAARGAATGVASPFQRIGAGIGGLVRGTWGRYVAVVGATAEADALREQVAELERRLRTADAARMENRRLRGLLGADARANGNWTQAEVIGRDLAHRYDAVTINRGSVDGIAVDAAIIGANGALVGRVVQVNRWTSLVQLLTGPLSGVGARLEHSRATGLASGLDSHELELDYITTRVEVAPGERVLTSGEDGIYPPDLLIGHVTSVEIGPSVPGTAPVPVLNEQTAMFKRIRVEPAVDVLALESVLVAIGPLEQK